MSIKILDVGQCGVDGPRMAAVWRDKLGAIVDRSASCDDAVKRLGRGDYDLVLVNRLLAADGSSGLDVIRDLLGTGTSVPVLLVSDRADAQDQAVALGATRGFGKAALDDPATLALVANAANAK